MVTVSCKRICWIFLTVITLALILPFPLWAGENPETSTSKKSQEQESVFQTLKRKTRTLFKSDAPAEDVQKETPETVEKEPEQTDTSERSPGRKAIDSFKKGMNKVTDNISESVERDKKTLKRKFEKLQD